MEITYINMEFYYLIITILTVIGGILYFCLASEFIHYAYHRINEELAVILSLPMLVLIPTIIVGFIIQFFKIYEQFDALDHSGKLAISDHISTKTYNPNTITNYAVISDLRKPVGRIMCVNFEPQISMPLELDFCKITRVSDYHYQIDICDGNNVIDYYGNLTQNCSITNINREN
jgi:hypothetical protein